MTHPLLMGFAPDDALLVDGAAGSVTAASFCGAAWRESRVLPAARYAIVGCEHPARFMLGSATALAAGHTLVFPPVRGADALREFRARFAPSYAIVDAPPDDPAVPFHVPDLRELDGAPRWPPPSIPLHHEAAILFTSGSTGAPAAQPKTWSALVRGAATFAATFGPPHEACIVGTVAPQHMFGCETTLLVPWQTGLPLALARPLYAGDLATVATALAARGLRPWLMTTPLHLRTFHAALTAAPPLDRVIVSTMPLPEALARAVERDWGVRVDEIYGCTEGGMLATRRPAADPRFTPAAGLAFVLDDDGHPSITGGQLDAPLTLADRFERAGDAPADLHLVGRDADLVKIAGKRATLAALNAALHAVPGVRDGAYVDVGGDSGRLAALVVAPGHDARSLRAALAARLDRAFLPRPLFFVAALPRDAQGKLPAASLARAMAAARAAGPSARPDRALVAPCAIPGDHPALPGHFPGRPVVPGVVLLERVERLLREHGLALAALAEAKFVRMVAPGEPLVVRVEVGDEARGRFDIDGAQGRAASGRLQWRLA